MRSSNLPVWLLLALSLVAAACSSSGSVPTVGAPEPLATAGYSFEIASSTFMRPAIHAGKAPAPKPVMAAMIT